MSPIRFINPKAFPVFHSLLLNYEDKQLHNWLQLNLYYTTGRFEEPIRMVETGRLPCVKPALFTG